MRARIISAVVSSLVGAIAGAAALMGVYAHHPAIRFDMDRDLPRSVRGFFPPERGDGKTFAWTRKNAEVALPDLNRRVAWVCHFAVLGWRPEGVPQPSLHFSVDGVERQTWNATGDPGTIDIDIPVRTDGTDGLTVALAVFDTFRPKDDPRDLGVAVDQILCEPASGAIALAPVPSIWRAAAAPAIIGAGLGVLGLPVAVAAGLATGAALLQAWPLAFGMAPYAGPVPPVVGLAGGLVAGLLILCLVIERVRRRPLSTLTRTAVGVSAIACGLKLAILLHPDMPAMDAVFQAHRLEWVMAGRYYFTSLTPDGYQFPYGISLYLAALPFASMMRDHVSLLRIVVCVTEMVAGLALFAAVARAWQDRATALAALVLFHTTFMAAAVAGTGNLTNAFGDPMGLVAAAVIIGAPLTWPLWAWLTVPILIALVAFTAHFSSFLVVAVALCAIGLAYYLLGGPSLERVATCVLLGLGLSTLLAVLVFYGHFWDTYRSQMTRLRGEVGSVAPPPGVGRGYPGARPNQGALNDAVAPTIDAVPRPQAAPATPGAARRMRPTLAEKVATLGRRNWSAFGWLLPSLAVVGLGVLVKRRLRDRVSLAVLGWLVTLVVCGAVAVLTPLELRYQLTVAPALAVLGGVAVVAGWRAGGWRRWTLAAAFVWAVGLGLHAWYVNIL